MDSASHTALPLVNPNDITKREKITYMSIRERKKCFGLYVLAHCNGQNLSFLSQQFRLVISLSMRSPLVRRLCVNIIVCFFFRDCEKYG